MATFKPAFGASTPCFTAGYTTRIQSKSIPRDVCMFAGVGEVIKVGYSPFLASRQTEVQT